MQPPIRTRTLAVAVAAAVVLASLTAAEADSSIVIAADMIH